MASAPTAATTGSTSARVDPCEAAAGGVATAVGEIVAAYNLPVGPPATAPARPSSSASLPTPAGSAPAATTSNATPSPPQRPAALDTALAAARDAVQREGCDRAAFLGRLTDRLRQVPARGAIAAAVLARLTASITGKIPATAGSRVVATAAELVTAVAEAPAGSTIRVAAGELRLDDSLVLLEGIRVEGAGADATTLVSSAPEAAVLVLSADRVELAALTLTRAAGSTGSGVLTGPAAALVLTGVTISGNRTSAAKTGGAGVHLSAQVSDAAPGRTTLEVTDSTFRDNAWAGVVAAGGHRVSIVHASFVGNGECGVCFLDDSDGSLSGSELIDNGVGLAAVGRSRPAAVDITVRGGGVGVQADDAAAPMLQRIAVSGSTKAAFIFAGTATGAIEDATCRSVPFGIVVGKQAAPTLTRTTTCALAGA